MTPLLSVIIPTHKRAAYAVKTIKTLLQNMPQTVQIVVSDSSTFDDISAPLGDDLKNSRLIFVRPEQPMNMVEHFNFALTHATGDFLCFIGDDDFVLPSLVEIVSWAKQNSVDAICQTLPAHYYWPDFRHKTRGEHFSGTLQVLPFTSKIKRVDAACAMRAAIRQLGTGIGAMPRAYSGLIASSLARRIVERHGSLFGGVSPDIYSSALICAEAKSVYEIDFPAIIPGSSQVSAAGQSALGKHVGKLNENDHIGAFKDLVWNPLIPEFYSVQTVWSFSLMQAAFVAPKQFENAGYGRLYVKCLIWHRHYRSDTMKAINAFRETYGLSKLVAELLVGAINESIWIAQRLWQIASLRIWPAKVIVVKDLPDSAAGIRASLEVITQDDHRKLINSLATV